MLNTVSDLITEVLVRNNRTTTDGFISDQMLRGWTRQAHIWGSSYHKWPFTEGRIATTFTAGLGDNADEWYFEGYKSDSIRLMSIGGKKVTKLNFDDYQIFKEQEPRGDDRVYTDYGRIVFVNPNIDATGTLVAYLQYEPFLDATDLTATTVFSSWDEEGNEALVEKMSSYLKRREHLMTEAELHDQRASVKLEELWKRIQDEASGYQTHPDRGGMFRRFDVINARPFDGSNFKRNENQF